MGRESIKYLELEKNKSGIIDFSSVADLYCGNYFFVCKTFGYSVSSQRIYYKFTGIVSQRYLI